jgi:hypothetical protein
LGNANIGNICNNIIAHDFDSQIWWFKKKQLPMGIPSVIVFLISQYLLGFFYNKACGLIYSIVETFVRAWYNLRAPYAAPKAIINATPLPIGAPPPTGPPPGPLTPPLGWGGVCAKSIIGAVTRKPAISIILKFLFICLFVLKFAINLNY